MDRLITAECGGQRLTLETRPGLFSPERADRGTLAMLSCARFDMLQNTPWKVSLRYGGGLELPLTGGTVL